MTAKAQAPGLALTAGVALTAQSILLTTGTTSTNSGPITLPLLGTSAAFGWSRRLRRRPAVQRD
jgi:hypothetical protein